MIDIGIMATSAVALLAPYFEKAAGKAAEKVGENAVGVVANLLHFLKQKFADHQAAADALDDLEEAPNDIDRQGSLRRQIVKLAERDSEFSAGLDSLLDSPAATTAYTMTSTQQGDNNKSTQITGNSNVVSS